MVLQEQDIEVNVRTYRSELVRRMNERIKEILLEVRGRRD
jgi:uncharacterized protein YbcI